MKTKTKDPALIAFAILLVLAIIALVPLLLIWAINTLITATGSTLQIEYTFQAWLAALVLVGFFSNSARRAAK